MGGDGMSLESRLLDLKETIKQDERELIEAQANLKTIMKDLKKEFKVDSIEDAENLLNDLTKREAKLATKIENAILDIEKQYESAD